MTGAYKEVRALTRGLDVLTEVNRGTRSVAGIAAAVGLRRPTVYRLLETLLERGYLVRSDNDATYRPSSMVRGLSEGFRDEAWIAEVAVPALHELLEQVQWPSDLATFDGEAMIALESTHRSSALSVHRPIASRRIAMVSALGMAYLAFCPERERRKILARLRRSTVPEDRWWRRRTAASTALATTARLGFANVEGEIQEGIMAVAVPVFYRKRPLACINVVVTRTAMAPSEMARRFLAPLRKAATRIEELLSSGTVEPPRRSGP